jgi:hypothetical protein
LLFFSACLRRVARTIPVFSRFYQALIRVYDDASKRTSTPAISKSHSGLQPAGTPPAQLPGEAGAGRLSAARLPCAWQKENENFNHEDLIEPQQS